MNTKQIINAITNATFIRIEGDMCRMDCFIFEDNEKTVYLLDEDSGEQRLYNLLEKDDMEVLQKAEYYELKLIKA